MEGQQLPEQFTVEPLETKRLRLPQFSLGLKIVTVAVIILLLGGISLFIFTRAQFNAHDVELSVTGPGEVAAGELVTYTVFYANKNNTALTSVNMTFSYPPEVIPLHEGKPAQATQERIDLGTLAAGVSGEKKFEAIMVGHQGNVKTARVVMDFVPERLTTQLQDSAEVSSTITTMPVALNVVVPPTVVSGQTVTYIIDYRNQTGETLRNMELHVRMPEGFTSKKTQTVWELPLLEGGEGGRITITGIIQGKEREVKTLAVSLQKEITTSTSRFVVDFEKAEASSVVSTPMLSLEVRLQNTNDYIAHVGDALSYAIVVTNTTDSDLSSLTLSAKLEGIMYDYATVESAGSFDSRTKTMLWNSSVVPELGLLRAHQSTTIPFLISLKDAFPSTLQTKDSFIKVSANVETFNVPDVFPLDSLSASDELTTRITTAPTFSQNLILTDTQFGATNPFPPKVDATSVFTVRWTIVNPSNEIAPAKVTGVLLPGMTWKGKFRTVGLPAGQAGTQAQPMYDPKTSTITWNLANVPPGVGVQSPAYELYFQVALTPSVNDVGQSLTLVKDARFEGTDILTKEQIVLSARDVTTSGGGGFGNSGAVQP